MSPSLHADTVLVFLPTELHVLSSQKKGEDCLGGPCSRCLKDVGSALMHMSCL
jgi:hypothetical protein